jgi:putative spermidine/putrescine transport system permease protein
VLCGALFAFLGSFDEVVVSLFLVAPGVRTLPVQMYASVTREIDPTIAAASSVLLAFTVLMLLVVMLAARRGGSLAGMIQRWGGVETSSGSSVDRDDVLRMSR